MSGVTPEMIGAGLNALGPMKLGFGDRVAMRQAYTAMKALDPEVERLRAENERVREALFVLSDRLRSSGILSASDAVHEAYEAVVAALSPNTSQGTPNEG